MFKISNPDGSMMVTVKATEERARILAKRFARVTDYVILYKKIGPTQMFRYTNWRRIGVIYNEY